MRIASVITEMPALPARAVKGEDWYHACDNDAAALGIIRSHAILAVPHPSPKAKQAPVAGRVYLTPSIMYACIVAIGGVFMGSPASPGFLRRGRYGYVFCVDESELTDVLPDEDVVGAKIVRAYEDYHDGLKNQSPGGWSANRDRYFMADHVLTDNEKRMLRNKRWLSAMDESRIGKRAIARLNVRQVMSLLDQGDHVSQARSVSPHEAWRLDKERTQDLALNGENFFDVAERCWSRG